MTIPNIIALATLGGFIPALVWLWFWLREDEHPEPWPYISLVFILGMVMVPIVIPFQLAVGEYIEIFIHSTYLAPLVLFFIWAGLEEFFKYAAAYFAALKNKVNDEPIDSIIYLIVASLGFAALESTLYLTTPISNQLVVDTVIIANLRFIGAMLLHVISSALVGIFLAFSFYKSKKEKRIYLFWGLFFATLLHSLFNLVMISEFTSEGPLIAIGITWFCAMVLIFMFEKIKIIKN